MKALSEGSHQFKRLVIATEGEGIIYPCGACRQLLHDYAPDIEVILYHSIDGSSKTMNMKELLPYPFGEEDLRRGRL